MADEKAEEIIDVFRVLRQEIIDGTTKVWCFCDEYAGPEPERWVPPDDFHADVHCLDVIVGRERSGGANEN